MNLKGSGIVGECVLSYQGTLLVPQKNDKHCFVQDGRSINKGSLLDKCKLQNLYHIQNPHPMLRMSKIS